MKRILTAGLAVALLLGFSASSYAIPYVAPTGQTATANFSFSDDGTTLQIVLTETTPAGILPASTDASDRVLTSVGFRLPDSWVIGGVVSGRGANQTVSGHSVTIGSTSASLGFDVPGPTPPLDFGPGTDVSGEWGATIGGEAPIDTTQGSFDFVSTNAAQVTRFVGDNLDGPTGLSGPQGGLLDDSANRGGLGVIDNSVIIMLLLDDPMATGNQGLTPLQQIAFLDSLCCAPGNSIVEWGSNAAFGTPVPEPGTLLLVGSGLVGLGAVARRRSRRK